MGVYIIYIYIYIHIYNIIYIQYIIYLQYIIHIQYIVYNMYIYYIYLNLRPQHCEMCMYDRKILLRKASIMSLRALL